MKKSLLALAVLGAFAGVASAQSSVSLYGTLDVNGKYVKNDGSARRLSMSQDGINSSQLGFKGVEDLGGGLKAGFVLLAGVNADTGTMNSKFFNRRATLSLMGNFGEIRLGRDYTPTFWNNTMFDAFGTNGLGDSSHVLQLTKGNAANSSGSFVRADNSVGYFLPSNIGGIYGQAMVGAAEDASAAVPTGNVGRLYSARLGYAAGPFDVAAAIGNQQVQTLPGAPSLKTYNIGGSYDLGVVKVLGYYDRDTLSYAGFDKKEDRFSLSAVVPMGQGEIHAGYDRSRLKDNVAPSSNAVSQYALGYVYNLSKRTAVYSNVSRVSNGLLSTASVAGTSTTAQTAAPTAGGKSTGAEFGVRHFF